MFRRSQMPGWEQTGASTNMELEASKLTSAGGTARRVC